MDNILTLAGLDPSKIKPDSNIKVTQDHIDQLFAGVAPVLKKYEKDNPLNCDYNCQKNKKETQAYQKYLDAKNNLQNAPTEFEEAEKDYYTISMSGQSYVNFKETQAKDEMGDIIGILSKNFDNKVKEVQGSIDNLNAQSISSKHMGDLEKSYNRDIYQLSDEIVRIQDKSNINDRLAVYYQRQITYNRRYLYYSRIFYWTALTVYLTYFLLFREMYHNKKTLIISLILIFIPLLLKPLVIWFFPIRIEIPPTDPVCPTKPIPDIPSPPSPQPSPPKKKRWIPPYLPAKPTATCPSPTIWSIIKNSLPKIGHDGRRNVKTKITNFEDNISWELSKLGSRIKNII